MTLQGVLVLIGAFCLAEGVLLMTMKKESWRRLRDFLAGLSAGQVHTVGVAMAVVGAALLVLGAL